jgi:hypothetical protein
LGYPNRLRSNNWKITLSNFPSLEDDKVPLKLFDEYCKSVTIPDLTLDIVETTNFQGSVYKESMSRYNDNLNPLIVEFIADEDLENYYYFYNWYLQLRSGETPENSIKKNVIKSIGVHMLDNQARQVSTLVFEDCLPSVITSLQLNQGVSEEVVFSVNFNFERLILKKP